MILLLEVLWPLQMLLLCPVTASCRRTVNVCIFGGALHIDCREKIQPRVACSIIFVTSLIWCTRWFRCPFLRIVNSDALSLSTLSGLSNQPQSNDEAPVENIVSIEYSSRIGFHWDGWRSWREGASDMSFGRVKWQSDRIRAMIRIHVFYHST